MPSKAPISSEEKAREANTKNILEKIAEINRNHGYTTKPTQTKRIFDDKSKQMYQGPQYGMKIPVWSYLQRQPGSTVTTTVDENVNDFENNDVPKGHYIKRKIVHKQTYLIPNSNGNNYDQQKMNQYLGYFPQNIPNNQPEVPYDPMFLNSVPSKPENISSEIDQMEQQILINNIRDIISNSQYQPPYSNVYNPFMLKPYSPYPSNPYQSLPNPNFLRTPSVIPNLQLPNAWDIYYANLQTQKGDYRNYGQHSDTLHQFTENPYYSKPDSYIDDSYRKDTSSEIQRNFPYNFENPDNRYVRIPLLQKSETSRQYGFYPNNPYKEQTRQYNLPLMPYFPSPVPKQPENQVYTSITTMTEYGQKEDSCEEKIKNDSLVSVRFGKGIGLDDFDLELLKFLEDVMKEVDKEEDITYDEIKEEEGNDKENQTVSSAEINTEEPVELETTNSTVSTPKRITREIAFEQTEKGKKLMKLLQNIKEQEIKGGPKGIIRYLERAINETEKSLRESTSLEIVNLEIIDGSDKKSKQMSSKLTQRPFIRRGDDEDRVDMNQTGSGIFINRLKVRKGGVAIAGPGGIATAGSGGTAIVGPNGVAYTQPNGIAIAGPGSRVIAVDPGIDLNKFVLNLTKNNESSPRFGKVVAIGPVVYYNKGQN